MSNFVETMVQDKARGRIVRDTALIESEWPARTPAGLVSESGYCTPASGAGKVLLTIPSSTWFKPRMLWITNENAILNHVFLYQGGSASGCSAIIGDVFMEPRSTAFIALDCVTCGKDIWAQADAASCHVRIGGILLPSGAE